MWHARVLSIIVALLSLSLHAQQLIINEVSQGTGSGEYVEFVVIGSPTCQTPVPCIDLRGVIIDDNNGYFAPGSGTGIAGGAIRFSNDNFWSCVPQGTYIVVYNEADHNPALPPDDESLSDGNCRLVLPATSALLEGTSASPNTGDPTYPASGWSTGASWSQVSMNNSNDSFQVPNLGINGTPLHAVSWGNNSSGAIIYFPGAASGKVFSFVNSTSSDWNLQANWSAGNVGTDETPGAANSPENDAWIASMNPLCGIAGGVSVQTTAIACGGSCNGTATAQVSNGTAPYSYLWSNGGTGATISDLCAGDYTVTVTDAGGCTFAGQGTVQATGGGLIFNFSTMPESCTGVCDGQVSVTVSGGAQPYQVLWSNGQTGTLNNGLCPGTYSVGATDINGCTGTAAVSIGAGAAPGDATIQAAGPFTTDDAALQLQSATAGGTWLTADCTSCLSAGGVFDPGAAGAGTFQVCHTVGNGACSDNDCIDIVVTQGCIPQATQETVAFCQQDSVLVFGNWETDPGIYAQTFADADGCDSTHTIVLELCGDAFSLFVPNTFTPNGDHINDVFAIVLLGGMLDEGYILNRWGNEIKAFTATDLSWDGTTDNGDPVPDGVYTYIFYYTPTGGTRQAAHGFVTVLR